MSDRIFLHPTLGINPRKVIVHCFTCGKSACDELVLLGRSNFKDICPNCGVAIYGGAGDGCPRCKNVGGFKRVELTESEKIERNGTCKECNELMKKGIILISVRDGETGDNPYRTGGWCVLKEEAVKNITSDEALLASIFKKRMVFIHDAAWKQLGLTLPEKIEIPK